MVQSLNKARANKLDSNFNINQAELIRLKILLKKAGAKPEWFTTYGRASETPSDIIMYENKLKQLQQQGFGMSHSGIHIKHLKNAVKTRKKQSGSGQCCGTQRVHIRAFSDAADKVQPVVENTTPEQRALAKALAAPIAEQKRSKPVGRNSLNNLANGIQTLGVSKPIAGELANLQADFIDNMRAEAKRQKHKK